MPFVIRELVLVPHFSQGQVAGSACQRCAGDCPVEEGEEGEEDKEKEEEEERDCGGEEEGEFPVKSSGSEGDVAAAMAGDVDADEADLGATSPSAMIGCALAPSEPLVCPLAYALSS